jgi:hypothetical protein
MASEPSMIMPQLEPTPPATLQGQHRHFISPEAFERRRRSEARQGEQPMADVEPSKDRENGEGSMPPPPKRYKPPMGESGRIIHNLPPRKGSSKANIIDYLV